MKRLSCILSLCMLLGASALSAQTGGAGQAEDIIDALQERVPGKGTVVVRGSDALRNMLGKRLHGEGVEKTDSTAFLKIQGYRTQVFSGNNQRKSKDEAFRKEKEIKELFPDVPTYVTYNAPFWRLRIGDFRSHEEAYHMQRLLMDAFPAYKKEMYIVREEVKIPLN
ncbi:SPOR domain-containing protein [uncultured Parabacteroides sp.]|uniref:SPOR domain-containing protein n=1 Tax=uncultured Parabacteroides sp. TaxID=512312 RepID=UPI002628E54B|nr:SPOR domain-containing protein [uncultured Parabacteroides sp.]